MEQMLQLFAVSPDSIWGTFWGILAGLAFAWAWRRRERE